MTIKVIALLETLKIKSQVVLKIRQKKNNNQIIRSSIPLYQEDSSEHKETCFHHYYFDMSLEVDSSEEICLDHNSAIL